MYKINQFFKFIKSNSKESFYTEKIKYIIDNLPYALKGIEPNNSKIITELLQLNNITIKICEKNEWIFNVNLLSSNIEISTQAIQTVWITLYVLFYQYHLFVKQQHCGSEKITIRQDEKGKISLRMFQDFVISKIFIWEDEWPFSNCPNADDNIKIADEMTLGALAFFIYHELSHVREYNIPAFQNLPLIVWEQYADQFAAQDLLNNQHSPDAKAKQELCVMSGLVCLNALSIVCKDWERRMDQTHPDSYRRMEDIVLNYFKNDPDSRACAWGCVCIQIFLNLISATQYLNQNSKECDSHYENLINQLKLIEKYREENFS